MKRKLQVFVSSTYKDLLEERQAAVAAILKAGHIPAGMELFNAGDKSQLDTIKRWIDESDVYMLILGGRYGSIEPESGKSYTEVEYDYAIEVAKPTFSVVMAEEFLEEKLKQFGSSVIERENSDLYLLFRKRVLKYISTFFWDVKDIKLAIHESLADFSANPKLHGWVSASDLEDTSILHDELRQLRAENETLKKQIEQSTKIAAARPSADRLSQIKDTIGILKATEIEIPERFNYPGNKIDLLKLFHNVRDHLINGVTNSMAVSEDEKFLFFQVAPKLIIHGIMENEKIAGVRYRRCYVTKYGREVLAEYERQNSRIEGVKAD